MRQVGNKVERRLSQLGFEDSRLHEGEFKHGRLFFGGRIDGEPATFLLDTGALNAVTLSTEYVERRGWKLEGEYDRTPPFSFQPSGPAGSVRIRSLEVLGGRVSGQSIPAYRLWSRSGVADAVVGLGFFGSQRVGIDARNATVGLSEPGGVEGALPLQVLRLVKTQQHYLPITSDVHDALMPSGNGCVLVLDSGSDLSFLTSSYVCSRRGHLFTRFFLRLAHRFGRTVRYEFELPNETRVAVGTRVVTATPTYGERVGVERIDGILGMNFLGRFVAVFVLDRGQVTLYAP